MENMLAIVASVGIARNKPVNEAGAECLANPFAFPRAGPIYALLCVVSEFQQSRFQVAFIV